MFGRTILRESTHSLDGMLSVESTTVHCAEDRIHLSVTPSVGHDSGHLPFYSLVTPVPRCVLLSLFPVCLAPCLCLSVIGARRQRGRIFKVRCGEGRGFTSVFVLGVMLFNGECWAGISLEILLNPSTGCSLLNLLQNTVPRISFIRLWLFTWLACLQSVTPLQRFIGIFEYKHPCKYVQ